MNQPETRDNPESGSHRRDGETYQVTPDEIKQYADDGYLVLEGFLADEEMRILDEKFDYFVEGNEQEKMKKDFCDMSQPYGTPIEQFQLVNAMLPCFYCPELQNSVYQKVAKSVADQLYATGETVMDYDQFLAKKPSKDGAIFSMHQDLGYWPKTENTWTATFSLALTDSHIVNGCLQVIPGTNRESELRKHKPAEYGDKEGTRDDSHTLVMEMLATDKPVYLPVKRGSVTVHDERIVHGSAGNSSDIWRKTYVMAFRTKETVTEEREMGFTHSHNDTVNWDTVVG